MHRNINEEISELKGIPTGKEFTSLKNIYKVVNGQYAKNFINGYDRKFSDSWNGRGNDSYGEVVYAHAELSGAIKMLGSFRDPAIVQFKLLGGTQDFVFFDRDNPKIKQMCIQSYGKEMNLTEQIYAITGDYGFSSYIGNRYEGNPSGFGRHGRLEIWKKGYYVRGMVCEYWGDYDDIVVYPFDFGDVISCAVAEHLNPYGENVDSVKRKFVGTLDDVSRHTQERFLDIVPYMEVLGAIDPNGIHYVRVGDGEKVYAPYETRYGRNIAIINDSEWVKSKIQKLFPDDRMLEEMPSNVSRGGNLTFKMGGLRWRANVLGKVDGEQKSEHGESPVFSLVGTEDWFEWEYLEYMYQNPDWVRDNLVIPYKKVIEEAFKPGMTYDDFTASNKAIGYVCSHSWSVNGILEHGFSREWASENDSNYNGGTGFYGDGVYGCVIIGRPDVNLSNSEMQDAGAARLSYYRDSSKKDGLKYGDVIFKCSIIGGWNNFLIFDKDLAQRIYKNNWTIEQQIEQIVGRKNQRDAQILIQAMGGNGSFRYEVSDYDSRTTQSLASLFRSGGSNFARWEKFFKTYGIRGAIYHGGNDGYAFVCYDYSEVVPIAVSFDHGKTFETSKINWEKTHERLTFGGDPVNKIGHLYKNVSRIPKKVVCNGRVFGIVNVETEEGKYNMVTTKNWKPVFPVNLDKEPTIGMSGKLRFNYKGYNIIGTICHEQTGEPAFTDPFGYGYEFGLDQLDSVIDYYSQLQNEQPQETEDYVEQNDETNQKELQESFFRFLDKIELL